MRFLYSVHNKYLVRGFLANSLPKAGTHLLAKALSLFPGGRDYSAGIQHFDIGWVGRFAPPNAADDGVVPLGVTWPRPVARAALRQALRSVRSGQFCSIHAPHSPALAALLNERGMKTVLIVRDPRDVVVASAQYIPQTPHNQFRDLYLPLSDAERIMLTIRGRAPACPDEPRVLSIGEACRGLMPWMNEACNYTTYFHKLVGPLGGGDSKEQVQEIRNLARHLGLRCSRRDLERIAAGSYGGTHTFRKGTTGGWRQHFTPEHKQAFKEVAGQVLIDWGYERNLNW
jgi:hypothetical protein